MASEYLMKKYKDVKPDEPKVLTKKEKRANWWYYHRIHLLIGAVVLAFVGSFVWEYVSKVEPDYQVAYFSDHTLAAGEDIAIEQKLTELADDRNGDGKVIVQVNNYVMSETDPTAYTVQVTLAGDISVGMSDFFLLEDPVQFQNDYGILTMKDGSVFDYGMDPNGCVRYRWADCPVLADLELETDLYITKRDFVQEEDLDKHATADALWELITDGAVD